MIRFDTRNKKPHLFGLLGLAVLFAAAGAALFLAAGGKAAPVVCAMIAVFCLITIVYLLISLRGQIQYNPYSYNTIYYPGFALFAMYAMITYTVLAVLMFRDPAKYTAYSLPRYLLYSARNYMMLTWPFRQRSAYQTSPSSGMKGNGSSTCWASSSHSCSWRGRPLFSASIISALFICLPRYTCILSACL